MAQTSLEQLLRDLPRVGTLVKDRGYRQVWRFEYEGQEHYLKFYPRGGVRDRWRRRLRGSPARREFERLILLQKAGIPSPRGVACLMGLRIAGRKGDAVILRAIEPAVQLDNYLSGFALNGEPVPNHQELAEQLCSLVYKLGRARLGHADLHPGNFLLRDGMLYLLDAYAVRKSGMRPRDIFQLGHSFSRFATTTDLLRGWYRLGTGGALPERNPVSPSRWRAFLEKTAGENRYFGKLNLGAWDGTFFKSAKNPRRWSSVSRMSITEADWQQAWPELIESIEQDRFTVVKRSRSGDVLAGEINLCDRTLPVVIKRPRRRYWYRYFNEIGRGARPRRAWFKSWKMIVRNVPCAWPLMFVEKRQLGYVIDTFIVFERVPGPTLAGIDLDALAPAARDMLFRRTGRLLRRIDRLGFSHFDAKASNWIVLDDEKLGPTPVLIDIDGIRHRRWIALGIRRLLRSLRSHSQYTPDDSLALCRGYAPCVPLQQDEEEVPAERAGEGSNLEEPTAANKPA